MILCVRRKHEGPAQQRIDRRQARLTEYDGVLASRSRHKEHHHLVCIGKGHRRLQPRVHGPEHQQPYPAVTEGISDERSRPHKPSKSARRRKAVRAVKRTNTPVQNHVIMAAIYGMPSVERSCSTPDCASNESCSTRLLCASCSKKEREGMGSDVT